VSSSRESINQQLRLAACAPQPARHPPREAHPDELIQVFWNTADADTAASAITVRSWRNNNEPPHATYGTDVRSALHKESSYRSMARRFRTRSRRTVPPKHTPSWCMSNSRAAVRGLSEADLGGSDCGCDLDRRFAADRATRTPPARAAPGSVGFPFDRVAAVSPRLLLWTDGSSACAPSDEMTAPPAEATAQSSRSQTCVPTRKA
jgi:hypothetical protein